ncbi:uncharacterized protein LY89DRAFT_674720 [Mollisia scopiformis]|uniref:Uncharacterized protein n=1 Tax=Mollisia scopiformis TaxID=149040 RepID=A0A194WTW1_MOLSC|nr:uncharacterized protein LY89DRAFT_674720 [Mollisia scopiformis]KUJ11403.1 hypothetical protein LY89DRAFT_674720 [Mollisia scopiformis]
MGRGKARRNPRGSHAEDAAIDKSAKNYVDKAVEAAKATFDASIKETIGAVIEQFHREAVEEQVQFDEKINKIMETQNMMKENNQMRQWQDKISAAFNQISNDLTRIQGVIHPTSFRGSAKGHREGEVEDERTAYSELSDLQHELGEQQMTPRPRLNMEDLYGIYNDSGDERIGTHQVASPEFDEQQDISDLVDAGACDFESVEDDTLDI